MWCSLQARYSPCCLPQVFSIVLSFVLYAKPVYWMHLCGGGVFVLSVGITIYLASVKKEKKHVYAPVATSDSEEAAPPPAQ